MDIRGTWTSNQLNVSIDAITPLMAAVLVPIDFNCPVPATHLLHHSPTNETQYSALKALSSQAIDSFVQSTHPPTLVQYAGTTQVVEDYESIRKALGYEKIHFLGVS